MKIIIRLFFLIIANSVLSKDITIVVDYTINKSRIATLKSSYSSILNDKNNIYFQYLGGEKFIWTDNQTHTFSTKCGFIECEELEQYMSKIGDGFITRIRPIEFCASLASDYSISDLSRLSRSDKKKLKKSQNIIILDLKGIKNIPLPDLIVNSSKSNIKAGENVELEVQVILNDISNSKGKIQWYINSEQIEGESKVQITLDKDSEIKCVWTFESCKTESNILKVKVEQCEYEIPYSLYFDVPQIYDRDSKDFNLIFIYPMHDANQSRVLLINQKCFFRDYEIEFFDEDKNLLDKKETIIDYEKSQEFLMNLQLTNPNLKAINVSDLISTEKVLYVRIAPKNLNLRIENMPKYKVFFTSCSPIE